MFLPQYDDEYIIRATRKSYDVCFIFFKCFFFLTLYFSFPFYRTALFSPGRKYLGKYISLR